MFIRKSFMAAVVLCVILAPTPAGAATPNIKIEKYGRQVQPFCFNECFMEYNECGYACSQVQWNDTMRCLDTCSTKFNLCRMFKCEMQLPAYLFEDEPPVVFWKEMCGFTCRWRAKYHYRQH